MNKSVLVFLIPLVIGILISGCQNGSGASPSSPDTKAITLNSNDNNIPSTQLWGYYDVYFDSQTQSMTASANRNAMFTANVTSFINSKPASLGFKINKTTVGTGYIDVDIDVSITHPFPGLPRYNGYDVRGVFMGEGSGTLVSKPLAYPVNGEDQFMFMNPDGTNGAPDGYTRWFNYTEFNNGGMPLFSYTQGKAASAGFHGTAELCPYRYFADGLGATDDLWTFLNTSSIDRGVFSSGHTNTRNYYLRFPNSKGVVYGYAVIANWKGIDQSDHPANASEAVAVDVTDSSNLFYIDSSNKGGDIKLDISLFDWYSQISGGMMEQYRVIVESTVLSGPHTFTDLEMHPIGGGDFYSTYSVDIPADNINGVTGNEYWVIVEYPNYNYKNDFGTTNLAGDDPLTAYFRFDLAVSPTSGNLPPDCDFFVVTPAPLEGWDAGIPVEFNAEASSDPDPGDTLTYHWDFDGNGIYDEAADSFSGQPNHPTHTYIASLAGNVNLKLVDDKGAQTICSVPVNVIAHQSKNIGLRAGVKACDLGMDHATGDLFITYSDHTTYKYTRSSYYVDNSMFVSYPGWGAQDLYRIDVNPSGYVGITDAIDFYNENILVSIYSPAGAFCGGSQNGASDNIPTTFLDSMAMVSGEYQDNFEIAYTIYNIPTPPAQPFYDTRLARYTQSGTTYSMVGWGGYFECQAPINGIDKIYGPWIPGCESDKNGTGSAGYVWFIENNDWYATRWRIYDAWPRIAYDNAYFGTGAQSDSDDAWNDARDITRDNQNRYFVLDNLSTGQPRIKLWTVSGNVTTSKGGFADSTSISGNPLRIEGSDFSGEVGVLHGDDTDGYMLSVFVPSEMPS